jgi:hypothetical protein
MRWMGEISMIGASKEVRYVFGTTRMHGTTITYVFLILPRLGGTLCHVYAYTAKF